MILLSNESKDVIEETATKNDLPVRRFHIQKPILKKSYKSEQKINNVVDLNKSMSEYDNANLDAETLTTSDSGNKIRVSTTVFLSDDPNPNYSNVTSTYHNRNYLSRTQSEKEIIDDKSKRRHTGNCTDNNCPLFQK